MEKNNLYQKYNNYIYYIIIGIISLLSVTILPALGSEVGLAFVIPNTAAGWIVWTINKFATAIINVLIFHCFMKQAKINIKDDEHYINALEILGKLRNSKYIPIAPQKWLKKQYGSKAASIFFGTAISTVGLTSAILSMNVVTLIVYAFTLLMGLVFGVLQMKTAEEYWTTEFYEYALYKQSEVTISISKEDNNDDKH